MTVRRNHYVPEFYLRMFAASGNHIFVYDKQHQEERWQSTKDTAVECDLYTAVSPEGELIDDIETELLQPFENVAAPLLKSIAYRDGPLPKGSAEVIGTFIALLSARVPRNIDAARELCRIWGIEYQRALAGHPDRLKKLRENYVRDTGDEAMLSVEEMEKYLSNPEQYFKVSFNRQVAMALSLMNIDVKLKIIPTLHWSFCRTHGPIPFVTSDCPVVAFAPVGDGKVIFNAYWYSPALEVSFPLSPHVCLLMRRRPQQVSRAVGEAFVKEINRRTAYAAERFIYSSLSCNYLNRLVTWAEQRRPPSWIDQHEARQLAFHQISDLLRTVE
jgi:hypothetical protein